MCLLQRIQKETEGFLPDWAYGFIAGRSCHDALLVANMTNRRVTALQGVMQVALLDVKASGTQLGEDTQMKRHLAAALNVLQLQLQPGP